jgi:lipoprotein-anchoring transpeptidase ErfK/SrfK
VANSHGGQGKETPTGTFRVLWKDQDHKSAEFDDAPMPYSVFFADGGIAFHQGNPNNPSAGCVHLSAADAQAWFAALEVGDEVQVR